MSTRRTLKFRFSTLPILAALIAATGPLPGGETGENPVPRFQWVQSTDAIPEDVAVAAGDDGTVLVSGHFRGIATLGNTELVGGNDADAFVARLDAGGAVLWARIITGPGAESGSRVVADQRGDVYVLLQARGEIPGTPIDFGGRTVNPSADSVVLVAKYSGGNGTLQWAQPCPGLSSATLMAALGPSGGVVIGGTSDAGTPLLLGFGSGGDHPWTQSPQTAGLLEITAMAAMPAGGVVVAGSAAGVAQLGSVALTLDGGFLAAVRPDGSVAWADTVTPGIARIEQVFVQPAGGYILVGTFDGRSPDAQTLVMGSLALRNAGNHDLFIVGVSPARVPAWGIQAGGAGDDAAGRGALDASGRLHLPLVLEGTASVGGVTVPQTATGAHVVEIAPGGDIDWVLGNAAGTFLAIAGDSAGNLFTVGTRNSSPTLNGFPIAGSDSGEGGLLTRIGLGSIPVAVAAGPASRMVPEGSPVDLVATAAGTPPFSYQWLRNGVPLEGRTTPVLTLPEVTVGDAGHYQVAVCDATGCASGSPTVLNVVSMPRLPAADWVLTPWGPAPGEGGAAPPTMVDMGTDAAGNVYLIGSVPADGVFEGYALTGAADGFFIASYSPAGELRWFTPDAVGVSCGPVGMAVNAAGECFVDGWSLAQAGDTDPGSFLNKYSATGARVWSHTDAGASRLELAAATQGGCTVVTVRGASLQLETLNASGNPSSVTDLSGIPIDNPGAYAAIAPAPSGGIYTAFTFTGTFHRWGDTFQPAGAGDVLLAHFDGEGAPVWHQTLRSAGRVRVFAMAAAASGRISLCGAVYGGLGADLGGGPVASGRAFAPFVAQYLGDGRLAWSQWIDSNLDFLGRYARVATDDAGRLYVSARSAKPFALGPYPLDPSVGGNLFLACYTPAGILDWVRQAEAEGVQLMAADPAGGVCAAAAVSRAAWVGGEWIQPGTQGVAQTLWLAHWVPRSHVEVLPSYPAAHVTVSAEYPGIYAVERSEDLHAWQPVAFGTNLAAGSFQVTDPSRPGVRLRAYRARLLR